MDFSLYLSFLLVSWLFIIIPGPNVLVIISASLQQGVTAGLATVAGTASAMALQLLCAGLMTTAVVEYLANGLAMLKWTGVVYLLVIGMLSLYRAWRDVPQDKTRYKSANFLRGAMTSLLNPKTILFFGAFLPQFTLGHEPYLQQIIVLSLSFWVLATVFDSLYACAAGWFRIHLTRWQAGRFAQGCSGGVYVAAGAWLALAQR